MKAVLPTCHNNHPDSSGRPKVTIKGLRRSYNLVKGRARLPTFKWQEQRSNLIDIEPVCAQYPATCFSLAFPITVR